MGANWDTGVKAAQHFENLAVRNFAHQIFWQADPDCVLLRERFHNLSQSELESLARTSALMGGVMTTSDDLGALGRERLELWRFCLSLAGGHCNYPLLGTEAGEQMLVQVRKTSDGDYVDSDYADGYWLHALNPGSEPVTLTLDAEQLQLPSLAGLQHLAGRAQKLRGQTLEISLDSHEDCLLRFG